VSQPLWADRDMATLRLWLYEFQCCGHLSGEVLNCMLLQHLADYQRAKLEVERVIPKSSEVEK
jgi:hypothetical protein